MKQFNWWCKIRHSSVRRPDLAKTKLQNYIPGQINCKFLSITNSRWKVSQHLLTEYCVLVMKSIMISYYKPRNENSLLKFQEYITEKRYMNLKTLYKQTIKEKRIIINNHGLHNFCINVANLKGIEPVWMQITGAIRKFWGQI